MPGSGTHKWKITTKSDSAQFYFNQGINMYYSFHIIEAMASFKKAAKFDPSAGMLYWAQALAYGPNINDVGYAASPEALTAVQTAVDLCRNCSEKEKMMVAAQEARYSADSTQTREHLNQVYVDKMKQVYQAYPNDPDVAALYADALMLQHPWDLWYVNGTPKPWTPEIRNVLEKMLALHPNHPGANHYYIHVMEPSPFAAKALPSADRLGKITPGLSHTVHMPSHIYLRTGNYKKGVMVNVDAVNSYKKYMELYPPVTGNDFLYIIHNLHMQTNQAMLAGRSGYAVESAEATRKSIPKDYLSMAGGLGNYLQYIYMAPVLVDVRFSNWERLLKMEQPPSSMIYANLIHHFGKGMAYARTGMLAEARNELNTLEGLLGDSILKQPFTPFSPAFEGATVAEQLLKGAIASGESENEAALKAFKHAVERESNMVYTEPRDWMLNPRHFLGEELLKQKKWTEAVKVFNDDLQVNNDNGWSLYGLHLALKNSNKKTDAARVLVKYQKAFRETDLSRPAF
jgi:tetratricopeptide (TPR) repeat protein